MGELRISDERSTPGEHGHETTAQREACPVCNPVIRTSNQCHCRACVGDHAGHGPCTLPGPSATPCWVVNPPTWHQIALKNDCAHCEIERLRGLLSKWVTYCDLSGAKPVSADVRDNSVLQLLKDSREVLPQ